jgi:aquaporin Z
MAYAIGHISGCHLNPGVSLGLATAQRWLFLVGPLVGATIAGLLYRLFEARDQAI